MTEKHVGKYPVTGSYLNIYMAIDMTCIRQYGKDTKLELSIYLLSG